MEFRKMGVRVGPAKYGQGVFATRQLRPGKLVGQMEGQVIDDASYGSCHCVDLGATLSLEPGAPFRYLNHSCDPNCCLVRYEVEEADGAAGTPEIWVEVLRTIAPGEELTIDYGWPAESAIPCGCGSPQCRGWIVDPEELPRLKNAQAQRRRGR